MALRVKCKCGKSMQIPSALAGKKVRCPGCKKPFMIPVEEFQRRGGMRAAAPAAEKKPPTVPEPPTEATAACPIELDLIPAGADLPSGNIPTLEAGEPSGLIPTAQPLAASPSGKLALTCPLCQKTLPPGAVVCIDCGFNVATGTHLQGSAAPTAAPVNAAPTATYASDRPWLAGAKPGQLDMDAIQAPKHSFWLDAIGAFAYPFQPAGNAITFVIVALIYLCEIPLEWIGCYGIVGIFFIEGWLAALMLSVIQDTASGSPDLPGIKMEDGVVEDIIKPFFKYIGAFAFAFLPAAVYIMLVSLNLLPGSLASTLNLLVLIIAAIFFWPMFLMLFSFHALDMLIRVDLIFTTIFRTFLPYLGMWVMLLLVGAFRFLPLVAFLVARMGVNIPVPSLPNLGGFTGEAFYDLVDLYLCIVTMRQIGLYYLHFKRRFTLVME